MLQCCRHIAEKQFHSHSSQTLLGSFTLGTLDSNIKNRN